MKKRVLFLCTANSARSIMAEALLRHHAGAMFEVCSAGTRPAGVDPRTIQTIEAYGIAAGDLDSKPVEQFAAEHFDFVITLCDKAARECRHWPGSGVTLHWDFPDPAASRDPMAFRHALQQINDRIKLFVLVNSKETGPGVALPSASEFFKCLGDETRLASMLLIDREGELCVCELVTAFQLPQPAVSRHLAGLRKAGLLLDRRQGQWVYYRLHPLLPPWMAAVLRQAGEHNAELLATPRQRLAAMASRPEACPPVAGDTAE